MSKTYVIQCVDPVGDVMYVREGRIPGEGEIVQFATRQDALEQVTFMKLGLEEGDDYESISVTPWREGLPLTDDEGNGRSSPQPANSNQSQDSRPTKPDPPKQGDLRPK